MAFHVNAAQYYFVLSHEQRVWAPNLRGLIHPACHRWLEWRGYWGANVICYTTSRCKMHFKWMTSAVLTQKGREESSCPILKAFKDRQNHEPGENWSLWYHMQRLSSCKSNRSNKMVAEQKVKMHKASSMLAAKKGKTNQGLRVS